MKDRGSIGSIGRGRNGITPWGRVYHCNLADQHIAEGAHMQNINHMVLHPKQSYRWDWIGFRLLNYTSNELSMYKVNRVQPTIALLIIVKVGLPSESTRYKSSTSYTITYH